MSCTARPLFRERANVQAAQDSCQNEPGETEAGLRIAIHVWLFTTPTRGHVSEGRYRLGQLVALAREPTCCSPWRSPLALRVLPMGTGAWRPGATVTWT
jgi:hypothetical protein